MTTRKRVNGNGENDYKISVGRRTVFGDVRPERESERG
jgi:hypothetical protein